MTPAAFASVAIGGVFGALVRFHLDRVLGRRDARRVPVATILVNCSGSFLLGLLAGSAHLGVEVEALVGTGFCGAYTTFSTWILEAVLLVETGAALRAAALVGVGLLGGLGSAGMGILIGLRW